MPDKTEDTRTEPQQVLYDLVTLLRTLHLSPHNAKVHLQSHDARLEVPFRAQESDYRAFKRGLEERMREYCNTHQLRFELTGSGENYLLQITPIGMLGHERDHAVLQVMHHIMKEIHEKKKYGR